MLQIFKSREFAKFAHKNAITEDALLDAASQIEAGLIDADLGGGVYKQRVARQGAGKSGGFRTILLMRIGKFLIFVDGFAKSERANISKAELSAFRGIAKSMLWNDELLKRAIDLGIFLEVKR